jgi:hypothetical protein
MAVHVSDHVEHAHSVANRDAGPKRNACTVCATGVFRSDDDGSACTPPPAHR